MSICMPNVTTTYQNQHPTSTLPGGSERYGNLHLFLLHSVYYGCIQTLSNIIHNQCSALHLGLRYRVHLGLGTSPGTVY